MDETRLLDYRRDFSMKNKQRRQMMRFTGVKAIDGS